MESGNLLVPPAGEDSKRGRTGGMGTHTTYDSILDPTNGGGTTSNEETGEFIGKESDYLDSFVTTRPSRATRFVAFLSVLVIVAVAAGSGLLRRPFRYETVSIVGNDPDEEPPAYFSDEILPVFSEESAFDFPLDEEDPPKVSVDGVVTVLQAPLSRPRPTRPRPTLRPTRFPAQPPSDDSELSDEDKEKLEAAFEGMEGALEMYSDLEGADNVMEGFVKAIEFAGQFSFLFGPLGPAVEVLAFLGPLFLPGPGETPDP